MRSRFLTFVLILPAIASTIACGRIWSEVTYVSPVVTSPSALAYRYFLYICGQDAVNPVLGYSVNPSTGQLDPVPGPLPTGAACYASNLLTISASDQILFIAGSPQGYKINPVTGALTLATNATFTPGIDPTTVVIDPLMRFVYGQDPTDVENYSYTVGASDSLAAAQGPYVFAAGGNQYSNCYPTSNGSYLYCVDGPDQTFSAFSVGATGILSPIAVTWPAGCTANSQYKVSLISDPASKYLFFGCAASVGTTSTIYPYQINSGSLIARATVTTASANQQMAIDNTGQYLYIQQANTGVSAYQIQANGSLNFISTYGTGVVSGFLPGVDPNNLFLASASGTTLYTQKINGDGSLSSVGSAPLLNDGHYLVFDPTGNFVFIQNATNGTLYGFKIDPTSGALTAISGVAPLTVMTAPVGLIFVKMPYP